MRFVGNITNGVYFKEIIENLNPDKIHRVQCAIAYAQNKMEILDFCYENNIQLSFWARYDYTVPVVTTVLKSFLNRSSENYRCYLIKGDKGFFHPKVYWFQGYGAYIGSANMTDKSWVNNIEAGIFLNTHELLETRMKLQLEDFFDDLSKHGTMLNQEIYNQIEAQEKIYTKEKIKFDKSCPDTVTLLNNFTPPNMYEPKKAADKKREVFVEEWNDTLQIIRDIEALVIKDENRPKWIPKKTPKGVQVDQFLHAFYYTKTQAPEGGRKYLYEQHYQQNKANPQAAVANEIRWWMVERNKGRRLSS